MPGVPLTYKTKQQILNNNDDEVAASPVSKNRTRFWDVHFINAAVALDYGNLSRLQGEKRRQVEELAQRMREDEDDDDDVEYEDEDDSEDEKEEVEVDIDEGEEEDETIQTAAATSSSSWSFLNVGSAIALWLITTTSFCLYHLCTNGSR